MDGPHAAGPRIEYPKKPITIENLANLNKYGSVTKALRILLANGGLADYDDELANRVKDAIEIVEGVSQIAAFHAAERREAGPLAEIGGLMGGQVFGDPNAIKPR